MKITVEKQEDRPVADVSRELDVAGAPSLRTALLKAAAEQPEAVLCDLSGARAERLALSVFLAVADDLRAWPSCPLLLVVPDDGLRAALERLGIDRRVGVARSRTEANAALRVRPPVARAVLRVAPTRGASAAARSFLHGCVHAWNTADGPDADEDVAALVLDELVTNAVVHGGPRSMSS